MAHGSVSPGDTHTNQTPSSALWVGGSPDAASGNPSLGPRLSTVSLLNDAIQYIFEQLRDVY